LEYVIWLARDLVFGDPSSQFDRPPIVVRIRMQSGP
jgi:hypothetical protein